MDVVIIREATVILKDDWHRYYCYEDGLEIYDKSFNLTRPVYTLAVDFVLSGQFNTKLLYKKEKLANALFYFEQSLARSDEFLEKGIAPDTKMKTAASIIMEGEW